HIGHGVKALWNGKLNVDVLDAASIGAALVQKDYKTAGSVMFLLNFSGLLEEYTHKRTYNALARSLSINVDQVCACVSRMNRTSMYDKKSKACKGVH
ncbi:MAG: hypothetical protein J6C83_08450, partial [Peptococcaceae bacterium]|nr:hypothetical protein [Peptococcaceae bacterium]